MEVKINTVDSIKEFRNKFSTLTTDQNILDRLFNHRNVQKYIIKEKMPPTILIKNLLRDIKKMKRSYPDSDETSEDDDGEETFDNKLKTLLGVHNVKSSASLFRLLENILETIKETKVEIDKLSHFIFTNERSIETAEPAFFLFDNPYLKPENKNALVQSFINLSKFIQTVNTMEIEILNTVEKVYSVLQSVDLIMNNSKVINATRNGLNVDGKFVKIKDFKTISLNMEKCISTISKVREQENKCKITTGKLESVIVLRTDPILTGSTNVISVRVFINENTYKEKLEKFIVDSEFSNTSIFRNLKSDKIIEFSDLDGNKKDVDHTENIRQSWRGMQNEKAFLILEAIEGYIHIISCLFGKDSDFEHSNQTYGKFRDTIVPRNILPLN